MNETDDETKKADKANQLLEKLAKLFPKVDEKTRKMIKSQTAGLTLEFEGERELRLFCIFHDNKNGTYRVTQGDVCFVDNLVNNVSFLEAVNSIIAAGIKAGEKVRIEDVETILRKTKLTGVLDSTTNERSGK